MRWLLLGQALLHIGLDLLHMVRQVRTYEALRPALAALEAEEENGGRRKSQRGDGLPETVVLVVANEVKREAALAALHGAWAGLAEFSRETFGLEPEALLRGATQAADVILPDVLTLLTEEAKADEDVAEELAALLFGYWATIEEATEL